jgi:hypothetical protein
VVLTPVAPEGLPPLVDSQLSWGVLSVRDLGPGGCAYATVATPRVKTQRECHRIGRACSPTARPARGPLVFGLYRMCEARWRKVCRALFD